MDIDSINEQIATIKGIIKAIPPNMVSQYKPIVAEFYNVVTQMETDMNAYRDKINQIKNSMKNSISSNYASITNIMGKLNSIKLDEKENNNSSTLEDNTIKNTAKVNVKNKTTPSSSSNLLEPIVNTVVPALSLMNAVKSFKNNK